MIKERWAKLNLLPVRDISILIGGGGEKVTLKLTAQHAHIWNGFDPVETFKHKSEVLDNWCREIGRDPAEIERSLTANIQDLDQLDAYHEAGVTHFNLGLSAPWDFAPVEKLLSWRANLK